MMIKHNETLDTYILSIKQLYTKNPIHAGGDISIDKNGYISIGKCGVKGYVQDVKGIAADIEGTMNLILAEWPIKKDASNVVYYLSKMPNQKTHKYNGKYTGFIYRDVKIEVPDDEESEDMQIGETLMTVDIDENKGIYIRMDLESDKQDDGKDKINAA